MMYDIVIYNGSVVTVNSDFDIITNGIITIKNGKIEGIEEKSGNKKLPKAKIIINAEGGIIMPGLVNTHTHLPMSLFRGLADDLDLSVWLNEHIFPSEKKHITPESVKPGAFLSCAEMLLSGTTTCCDGYFYEDHVAQAVKQTGIRAVLGQGIIDFPAPGVPDPLTNIDTAINYVKKWKGVSSLIHPSIFCHSPYTCSKETLQKAKAAADSKNVLFQIHVAETKNEYDRILAEHGKTPIKYLDDLGIMDENTLLVHGVWIDDADIEIIAKQKSKVSHNPESNMKLSSGVAPLTLLINAGVTVGLGTDGCASNNDLDLFGEMDTAAKIHKVNAFDPTVMDAVSVLKMATINGAKALRLERQTGSIEKGKRADIIVVNTNIPHLVPMYNPVSQLVYSASGSDVRHVIIDGNMIVKDRQLLTINEKELLAKVNILCRKVIN